MVGTLLESRWGTEPDSSHQYGRGSEGLGRAGKCASGVPEPGRPPPELKRGPRLRQAKHPADPKGRPSSGRPTLWSPLPTDHARRKEAEGRRRGRSPAQVSPRRAGKSGPQAPQPSPGKRNHLLRTELCSPPPEPEVIASPEVGSGRTLGSMVGERVALGLGGAAQLHGFNPWWCSSVPSPCFFAEPCVQPRQLLCFG